jgi:type IV secretory pathway TrbD component
MAVPMSADLPLAVSHVHPVYASVNRPLTIGGADRRLFFVAISVAAGAFAFFGSALAAAALGAALFSAARWMTQRDPQGLAIALRSGGVRRLYDPGALSPLLFIDVSRSRWS